MADMKLHVEMLNGLSEDVRACVEQARERVDTYEQEISNVSSEQVASKAEKKSIKQSFSLKDGSDPSSLALAQKKHGR